ncbi:major histocompatibility complex class I-related gene protein-like [Eucyclogobius newberryi]|uniref:major histocompatibility complex class I-related gene protein-like n=1 Tax=Eucyclogobius newberryi TaxID=166745 RepID=UPI003B5A3783
MLFWTKDGDELLEDVDPGEILPNHDGTFQKSVELDVSSIPSEDWGRYHCVFKFSNNTEDTISVKLDKDVIKSNSHPSSKFPISLVIGAIVGALIITIVCLGAWKFKQSLNRSDICGQDTTI